MEKKIIIEKIEEGVGERFEITLAQLSRTIMINTCIFSYEDNIFLGNISLPAYIYIVNEILKHNISDEDYFSKSIKNIDRRNLVKEYVDFISLFISSCDEEHELMKNIICFQIVLNKADEEYLNGDIAFSEIRILQLVNDNLLNCLVLQDAKGTEHYYDLSEGLEVLGDLCGPSILAESEFIRQGKFILDFLKSGKHLFMI